MISRFIVAGSLLFTVPAALAAQAVPPQPVFAETFAYDGADPSQLLAKWMVSKQLGKELWRQRVAIVADPVGHAVGRITVREGDALDDASEAALAAHRFVCDAAGSHAAEIEAEPGGSAANERVELETRFDRATGVGALVKFGAPIWYRFAFKVPGDWPRDVPTDGRAACRTVIHQVKQDAWDGHPCGASPFFKIEARPLAGRVEFFGQVTTGAACLSPPAVKRVRLCEVEDLPTDRWTRVNVRLYPMQDAAGRVDLWLDGTHCGSYQGPMGDPRDGVRRNGTPFVNAQPRFGIYRDWRAEPQTIFFDKILFWDSDPTGHPDWGIAAAP